MAYDGITCLQINERTSMINREGGEVLNFAVYVIFFETFSDTLMFRFKINFSIVPE
jgi:hypothetical protein